MWLWENRCTLMEDLTLKTLLFTIVKNKALNRLSHFEIKRKVHQEIVDKYDSELNNPDFYLSDELFRLYEEALKRLPKEYLEAYEMNRNQHLTHKEIAEKLNVSPQTINYRIGQALKLLRVALKDYLPLFILIFGPNLYLVVQACLSDFFFSSSQKIYVHKNLLTTGLLNKPANGHRSKDGRTG